MRTQLLAFITSVVTVASATSAQVSLEMEPLEANSFITDITLYRGRAAITRSGLHLILTQADTQFSSETFPPRRI